MSNLKPTFPCGTCVGNGWEGWVPASGDGSNGVLIVAEAPGAEEAVHGVPLIGSAGEYLWNALKRVGIERDGFTVHNVLSCRPPDNKLVKMPYEFQVIKSCAPLLDATIEKAREVAKANNKTFVIVALGRTAFKRVLGLDDYSPIMKKDYLCYPFWSEPYGAWVIGAQHPSYLMRGNHNETPMLQFVFTRALEIASKGLTLDGGTYLLDPSPSVFESWIDGFMRHFRDNSDSTYLSYDIETPMKQDMDEEEVSKEEDLDYTILRCSFSYKEGEAVSVPWSIGYMRGFEALFGSGAPLIGWNNINYDSPRVSAQVKCVGAQIDAMLGWHVLNSALRKGLGFVAPFYAQNISMWKHLNHDQPAYYNCLHAETRLVAWDNSTHRIADVVKNRQQLVLRGMDEHGNAIPVNIIDWHKQIVKGQKWLKIYSEAARQPIICTPDHKIWTAGGWREAKDLKVGSYIKSSRFGHPELIHGMLLGDSSVTPRGRLGVNHGLNQQEYFELKHRNLDATKPSIVTGGYGTKCLISDAWIPKFWRDVFYKNGKKRFVAPRSDAALAIWYCDDGCFANKHTPRIALYFPEGNNEAYDWFADRFYDVSKYNETEKGFSIAIRNRKDFFESIAEWVPPCMDYKLPEAYRGRYNGWLDTPKPQDTVVTRIEEYIPKFRGQKGVRYCVTVDHPTHRFMTLGGLVKNCKDADVALRCWNGIERDLKSNGLWEMFHRHIIQAGKVFSYMSSKGIVLDQEMRNEAEIGLTTTLRGIEESIDRAIPLEAKALKVYKKIPKDLEGLVRYEGTLDHKVCPKCGAIDVKADHFKSVGVKKLNTCVVCGKSRKLHCDLDEPGLDHDSGCDLYHHEFKGVEENPCVGSKAMKQTLPTTLWAEPLDFKISQKSLLRYQKIKGHAPIIDRKKKTPVFDEPAIERLMKRYPKDTLYPLVLDLRSTQKLRSTYIGITQEDGTIQGGMPIGRDGRIHTTFTRNPSTLRSASQNPNLQNLPRPRGEDDPTSVIRNLISAENGNTLIARDYCVDPASKILKTNLTWESASNIQVGDELIGFDEEVGNGHKHQYKKAIVTNILKLMRPKVKVTTTMGTTVVSADHPFVARYKSYKRKWVKAEKLKPGMLMPFLGPTWETDNTRNGGYIAGFLDGEGYLGRGSVGFGQNQGKALQEMLKILDEKGYKITQHGRGQEFKKKVQFKYACVSGLHHQLRLLGSTRPVRLLNRSNEIWEGKRTYGKTSQYAEVISVEPIGDGEVIAIETSSKTFISDGYFSHNCGIEAVLVGYFAMAKNYIRLAKMDVHSFYTAYAIHELDGRIKGGDLPLLSWDDAKLASHLAGIKKEFKSERNELYKHLVHGANFMQSPKGASEKIFRETKKEFPIKTVSRVMDIYFELFPEIKSWHLSVMLQAEKDGFLRNPFGYIHRFSKVFEYEKIGGKWQKHPGPQANQVIAFLPQSTAAGIIVEAMLRLYENRFEEAGQYLRLLIHDELFLETPESMVEEIDRVVKEEMERPIQELILPESFGMGPYLGILTESKQGLRWGGMH